ncbi:MAG: stress protein [Acidobacteria bacterium]|nr:MAG: stress protein [Acidobacteriota bacterium]
MIEHLVLFKVKPETPAQAVEEMLAALRGLKSVSPQILELSCGTNFSPRSQGFTHGLRVRFASRADLEAYAVAPEHQRVLAERIRPIVESILALDYEA